MAENKEFVVRDKRRGVSGDPDGEPRTSSPEGGRAAEQSEPEKSSATSNKPGQNPGGSALPPFGMTFSTFLLSLSTSAAMNLGGYNDPVAGQVPQNLELAKQSIDILGLLKEKTKGNLDSEEQMLLDSALFELRMRYVDEVKRKGL